MRFHCCSAGPAIERLQGMPRVSPSLPQGALIGRLQHGLRDLHESLQKEIASSASNVVHCNPSARQTGSPHREFFRLAQIYVKERQNEAACGRVPISLP